MNWIHIIAALALGVEAPEADKAIRITEINYHPRGDDDGEEYIEILNSGQAPVDLSGWSFTSGVSFQFPQGSVLGPGEYLAVCADMDRIAREWEIENVAGNWTGKLSNDGERIHLVNSRGENVQTITYGDAPPWPGQADGGGSSLERLNPLSDIDYIGNWAASRAPEEWLWIHAEGIATGASVLLLYLEAPGEALVTGVALRRERSPENLLQNGDFAAGLTGWTAKGNHQGTEAVTVEGPDGIPVPAARIVATGKGSSTNLLSQTVAPALGKGQRYGAELWVKPLSPRSPLRVALSGATAANKGLTALADFSGGTPGRRNSNAAEDLPPAIDSVQHLPQRPTPDDEVLIIAAVIDDRPGPLTVEARWDSGGGENVLALLDDGQSGDGAAGDQVYGGSLGKLPQNTLVQFYLTAADSAGNSVRSPANTDPGTTADPLTTRHGVYVEPPDLTSEFPIYHLLLKPADLSRLNGSPRTYVPGHFVAEGEVFPGIQIRYRGQSSIGWPKKHWKVKLNDDKEYYPPECQDQPEKTIRNLNLNSSWGDKTFLRERFSFEFWKDAGQPTLMTWYCRVYLNGAFSGFHVYVEQPNEDFLRRNQLNPRGFLWKSYSQMQGGSPGDIRPQVPDGTPPTPDTSLANQAVQKFAQIVGGTSLKEDQLYEALLNLFDVESFIDYQALNDLVHNCDQPAKNYLIYGDADTNRWTYFPWDMDLTLGRNYVCGEAVPAGQNALTNDNIWADAAHYGHVFFGTREYAKCDGPWNGATDVFYYRVADFREPLYARVSELNEKLLKPEVFLPKIEDLRPRLRAEVAADRKKWGAYGQSGTWDFDARVNDMVGFVRNRYADLNRQVGDRVSPPPTDLACVREDTRAAVSWKNQGAYEAIKIYLDGQLVQTLAGSEEKAAVDLSGEADLHTIEVTTTYAAKERLGATCSVISDLPGYRIALAEDFSSPSESPALRAGWALNGSARVRNGRLEITPEDPLRTGSAFLRIPLPAGDFMADFDFAITGTSTGAEGMTFAWIRGGNPKSLGGTGNKLGFFGIQGYAVEFDTAKSSGETSARHVAIDRTESSPTASVASADIAKDFEGAGFFHCRAVRREGAISVSLSNPRAGIAPGEAVRVDDACAPEEMLFGFTGASGSGAARSAHLVDNFILRLPAPVADPVRPDFSTQPASGKAPLAVRFTNLTAGIGVQGYRWDFGDGKTSTEESPLHTYDRGGAFDVSLTVLSESGNLLETRKALVKVSATFPFIRGDADLNGVVDLPDALTILEHLFERARTELPCLKPMDVNDSGTLEIADAVVLLRHLYQGGRQPPAPFPAAGADPTSDSIACPDIVP